MTDIFIHFGTLPHSHEKTQTLYLILDSASDKGLSHEQQLEELLPHHWKPLPAPNTKTYPCIKKT
jgi:hypothetical protein